MKAVPVTLGFVCVLFCLNVAFAGQTVGWIEAFEHDAENFELKRNGRKIPISIYAPLENGDRIIVLEGQNEITLFYTDGRSLTINHERNPYIVQSKAEAPSVLGNMMDWAQEVLDRWKSVHQSSAERMEMRSRSLSSTQHASLSIPMLAKRTNRITSGTRNLLIVWNGGQGPFEVTLTSAQKKAPSDVLYHAKSIDEREVKLTRLIFLPEQKYTLTVTDAKSSVTRQIVSVESYEQPEMPRELAESTFSEEIKEVLYAAWLTENHPDWRLEAYQSLSSTAKSFSLAGKFQTSLAKGHYPK